MTNKVGRNAPCPCGSGKKYKRCCLVKNTLASTVDLSQELISCYECGERIDTKFRSYFSMSGANGQKICFCSVCYRDMACTVCGKN